MDIPALSVEKNQEIEEILMVQLTGEDIATVSQTASIKYTISYSEAQQIDEQINQDRLGWIMNQCSTELLSTQDPHRTGELLIDYQVAATKSGNHHLASQAEGQYKQLEKKEKLDSHKMSKLYQETKKLGER